MLPTFVIGLREGLEAALIVGIIAAFLRKQGRLDLVRWVFAGVGVAIVLCLGVGITLNQLSKNLPQRQQEGLETVIGALAVVMVTYMVIWMRRHSRDLKGQLESLTANALGGTSRAARAMVLMAFLAVLREGFETVVFLLAAFNESHSGSGAGVGAALGLLVAIGLGYGIYRGGVRLNLSKFFRATGLVLVLVAAGLVVNALHTAHEAGWINSGQGSTVDLSWLVRPGSVQSSLLTGMLGIQPRPVLIEVIGWLVYLIPVGLYVAWPPGRSVPKREFARAQFGVAVAAAAAAITCALLVPASPSPRPVTTAGAVSAQLLSRQGDAAVIRTQIQSPAGGGSGPLGSVAVKRTDVQLRAGVATEVYVATVPGTSADRLPGTLGSARIAELNGGRLPLGLRLGPSDTAPATYVDRTVLTVWVEPRLGRVIDLRWVEQVTATVTGAGNQSFALGQPVAKGASALPSNVVTATAADTRPQLNDLDRRHSLIGWAWFSGGAALVLALGGLALTISARREPDLRESHHPAPVEALVKS